MKKIYTVLWMLIILSFMVSCGKKEENTPLLLETETTSSTEYTEAAEYHETAETEPETTLPATTEPMPTREPIQITKHPSGETVYPTARTWFIAHAENADTISWVFTEPETGMTYDHETVLKKHKCLETEILPEDTIALRKIPLSMDGWTIQAVFSNESETVLTDPAKISVIGIEQSYRRVIDFYSTLQHYPNPDALYEDKEMMDNEWFDAIPELPIGKGPGSLGYFLRDFDGDDIPEFCLGLPQDEYSNADSGFIRSLYTLRDGKIELLLNSWSRSRNYLLEGNDILFEGSGGAEYSFASIGHFYQGEFVTRSGVWSDGHFENGEIRFFKYVPGQEIFVSGVPIGRKEYSTYIDENESNIIPLPKLTAIP